MEETIQRKNNWVGIQTNKKNYNLDKKAILIFQSSTKFFGQPWLCKLPKNKTIYNIRP